MRRRGRSTGLVVILVVLAVIAAACGSSKKGNAAKGTTATTAAAESVPTGGTLVVGAEQEPDCTDWVGSCGGSSWGFWTLNVTTMTRPYNVEKVGDGWGYKPSNLLTGEATITRDPKLVVTYHINPQAKWSDGQPITATDFKFTWDQVAHGKDIYDRSGYDKIESVDDSKPDTAVVTYKEPYSDWKGVFGGGFGLLPQHLIKDHSEMANGYQWSAGPWKIESWQKGQQATLIPNPNYWGDKPKLDKIVFKFITDTSAEFQAFKAGETMMGYPQPQLDAVDQIVAGLPDANSKVNADTGSSEALWMNNGKAPFNDKTFRQAVAYSIDRDAIVNRLFGKIGVTKALNTFTAPILKKFATTDAFAGYKKDLDKVNSLMTGAGWTKGSDGIWAKGGQQATFEIKSTAGNKRRELTEQVLQQQLKDAGFNMTINNQKSGDLFGSILPKGDYQMGLFANVLTSFAVSNCNLFCSKNIPSEATKFSGNNWYRVNIPELDTLLLKVDSSTDDSEVAASNKPADTLTADNVVGLPLDPLPNIVLWNKKVVGPIDDNPVQGPFWNSQYFGIRQ